MPKTKPEPRPIRVSVFISRECDAKIEKIASAISLSKSNILATIIDRHVNLTKMPKSGSKRSKLLRKVG